MKKLTQYQKGWLSGIIDGEGSISLIKEKRPHFKAGCTYKARFNVGNTDLKLLKEAQKICGGGHICKRKPMENRKQFWTLDISANIIRDIFPQIKLIAKEKQKQLLLKALLIIRRHITKTKPRTNKEIKQLESIYQEIRKINGHAWNKL